MKFFSTLADRRKYWQRMVADWQQSGLTKSEFSRQRGIRIKSLSRWVCRLKKMEDASADSQTPHGRDQVCSPVTFVAVPQSVLKTKKVPVSPRNHLVLRVGNNYRIVVPDDFRPETLSKMLRVLGEHQ